MAGYKLFAISGIDGNFMEFDTLIGNELNNITICKLPYDKSLSFKQNLEIMRSVICKNSCHSILMGWSIGAVISIFLADCKSVSSIFAINAFYNRSEILAKRGITCDENVLISDANKQQKKYIIICGALDDKISPIESQKITKYLEITSENLIIFPKATHSLSSFPSNELLKIIKNNIES